MLSYSDDEEDEDSRADEESVPVRPHSSRASQDLLRSDQTHTADDTASAPQTGSDTLLSAKRKRLEQPVCQRLQCETTF